MQSYNTMIKVEYKRNRLVRSRLLSGVGIALLVGSGVFLPVGHLTQWGWLIFLVSGGLITIGMIPYRQLTLLEEQPDKLVIDDADTLHYIKRGKEVFVIPCGQIKHVEYLETPYSYGIVMHINDKKYFYPYFSKLSFEALMEKHFFTTETKRRS